MLDKRVMVLQEVYPLYRGFRIYYDPPPIPMRQFDWQAQHEENEEHMCYGKTLADCKADIDRWHEENEE